MFERGVYRGSACGNWDSHTGLGVGEVRGTECVVLGLSCQLWGGQKAEVLPLATRGAPSTVFIVKHHHGVHMPDLCGRGAGSSLPGARGIQAAF